MRCEHSWNFTQPCPLPACYKIYFTGCACAGPDWASFACEEHVLNARLQESKQEVHYCQDCRQPITVVRITSL